MEKKALNTLPWIVSAQNRDFSLAAHHPRDTSQGNVRLPWTIVYRSVAQLQFLAFSNCSTRSHDTQKPQNN